MNWFSIADGRARLSIRHGFSTTKICSAWCNAHLQIEETRSARISAGYNLIWMHVKDELTRERVLDALYGTQTQQRFIDRNTGRSCCKDIYYAKPCLFASRKSQCIDAVMLSKVESFADDCTSILLCINSFGLRTEQLLCGPLVNTLIERGGKETIFEPLQSNSGDLALVVNDIDLPRSTTKKPCAQHDTTLSPEVQVYLEILTGKIVDENLNFAHVSISLNEQKHAPANHQKWHSIDFFLNASVSDVNEVLASGADVNEVDGVGNTALHYALAPEASTNHEIINVILDAGADPYIKNFDRVSALVIASYNPYIQFNRLHLRKELRS